MGCAASGGVSNQARSFGVEEAKPLKISEEEEKVEPSQEQPTDGLVEPAQRLLSQSHNAKSQQALDTVFNGEDFTSNKWYCIERPRHAYYALGPYARLEIELVEARKLIPPSSTALGKILVDEPDAFVKAFVDDCLQYTSKTIKNKRNPHWNDKQQVDIVAERSMVRLSVYDSDFKTDEHTADPLGFVEFCVGDMRFGEELDGWLELRFPANLQDSNLQRYATHRATREDEMKFPHPTKQEHGPSGDVDDLEAGDITAMRLKSSKRVPHSMANRMFKRMKYVVGKHQADHTADVQYNAGEIRVRMKLVRLVDPGDAWFAKALTPAYQTFSSFVQEEYLPEIDFQELVDDIEDIKITVLLDTVCSTIAFVGYIMAWRSMFLTGLLALSVLLNVWSGMIGYAVFLLWLVCVLLALKSPSSRVQLTTNGMNASLDQEGFEYVVALDSVPEMHEFVVRLVAAVHGNIISMPDLLHFSGTIVRLNGTIDITYHELLRTLKDVWFVDLAHPHEHIKKGTLVRVFERRRGTVTLLTGSGPDTQVTVAYDEPEVGCEDSCLMEETVPLHCVLPRLTVPRVPRRLLPRGLRSLTSMLMFQVNSSKEQILPGLAEAKKLLTWTQPMYMYILIALLLVRVYLSIHGFYDPQSWAALLCHIMAGIWHSVLGIVVVGLLVCKCRAARILKALAQAWSLRNAPRTAPETWKFFKEASKAYA